VNSAKLNFALTEFSEVDTESALGAETAPAIGASLVTAFLLDLRFGALRVEAQAGRRWLITPKAVGDFDEILVGVPQVHGQQRSGRPRASHGSFEDLNAVCPKVFDDLNHRRVREEAQVGRTRGRNGRLWLELSASLVEVDLLLTECQGVAAFAEEQGLHAEDSLVEVAGASDVAHGQNEVVESLDLNRVLLRWVFCHRRGVSFH
jgi:hypothetical protein